jgi:hypothetical protein
MIWSDLVLPRDDQIGGPMLTPMDVWAARRTAAANRAAGPTPQACDG